MVFKCGVGITRIFSNHKVQVNQNIVSNEPLCQTSFIGDDGYNMLSLIFTFCTRS